MTELVIDSSVVIKWFVPEPYSSEAQLILNQFQQGTLDLLSPDLLYAEIGNILWKKQRTQGLPANAATAILQQFRAIPFAITPCADLLDSAYRLAITHQRTVYDSLYLALSLREGCTFVTADERLVNALTPHFPNVVWLANWT
ncbi:MAG: type II toxin-antitoxin system VapC family toxin [Caldilineaceae bacterium]